MLQMCVLLCRTVCNGIVYVDEDGVMCMVWWEYRVLHLVSIHCVAPFVTQARYDTVCRLLHTYGMMLCFPSLSLAGHALDHSSFRHGDGYTLSKAYYIDLSIIYYKLIFGASVNPCFNSKCKPYQTSWKY